ncbi:MAG: hypothetical protein AMS15_03795 [Planctomycetes bacterium DG_23]|nr:MAG: hypothetical protein AMS15_03795 [Planctomycetes bacterium DG_23]
MAFHGVSTALDSQPLPNFADTPAANHLPDRALAYIKPGLVIHCRSATAPGETVLAPSVASGISRPVVMIHDDKGFSISDLIGRDYGYRMKDRFYIIRRRSMSNQWWYPLKGGA